MGKDWDEWWAGVIFRVKVVCVREKFEISEQELEQYSCIFCV